MSIAMCGIVVPALVRERAARLGPTGAAWLAGLSDLIADLERQWSAGNT